MANPQKEDGHTEIANELMEALARFQLTGNEWRILVVVIRKTYGWNKRQDAISLSQFQRSTGMIRPRVCEAIDGLVRKNVLVRKSVLVNRIANVYQFQKNYEDWRESTSTEKRTSDATSTEKRTPPVRKSVLGVVRKSVHTIDNVTKDNSTKDNNTTSVVLGGKPHVELQALIDHAAAQQFPAQGTVKTNRQYAWLCLQKYGLEPCKRLVDASIAVRGKPYAPTVHDFGQLYKKAGDLASFIKSQQQAKGFHVTL